jgi:hypothetical protein
MTLQQRIVAKLQGLPLEKQQAVLDLVESLSGEEHPVTAARPLRPGGLWGDLGVHVSEQELEEARREMWGQHRDP